MNRRQAKGFRDFAFIGRLYRRAFPRAERKPLWIIKRMQKKGRADVWLYEEEGRFVGFASTINGKDAVLIDYLAVDDAMRAKGKGTEMLLDLGDTYGKERVFLEIEAPDAACPNNEERLRRKAFYLRCGMEEMQVKVILFSTRMELLSFGYKTSYEDYRAFYRDNYAAFAASHISPVGEPREEKAKRNTR